MRLESQDRPQHHRIGRRYGADTPCQVDNPLALFGFSKNPIFIFIRNGGEQHSEEYKRVNPLEQVPALVVNESEFPYLWRIYMFPFSFQT